MQRLGFDCGLAGWLAGLDSFHSDSGTSILSHGFCHPSASLPHCPSHRRLHRFHHPPYARAPFRINRGRHHPKFSNPSSLRAFFSAYHSSLTGSFQNRKITVLDSGNTVIQDSTVLHGMNCAQGSVLSG